MSTADSLWHRMVGFFLQNRLIVFIFVLLLLLAGAVTHPFNEVAEWAEEGLPLGLGDVPRERVAVDAIPDIGENQQIVFTRWEGRSPRDIEDQITYPLTTQLMGLPGVKTVRSASMFGFSSVQVIFEEGVEFYWGRTRILEKLNGLAPGALPPGATPTLGPDATALGQVYWYTLEGRDPETGEVVGGWDLHELRTLQDWTVRPGLQATAGVSEVASVGGLAVEWQVDVDPRVLQAYDLSIMQLAGAVREANQDIGARTMEINRVEYVVRGVGQLETLKDLEAVVVAQREGKPVRVRDVARVQLGPANRRGALDVGGAQSVGGVVVARYGANPVEVIEELRAQIQSISQALPRRTLPDGRTSQVTLVPFYDRSVVVQETLETLSGALYQQILITILVVLVLLGNLRASMAISATLPLAVLGTFVLMKATGVTANVMSLAGIAIAIGTMVDMGIVLTESIVAELELARDEGRARLQAIRDGAGGVAPAIATSVATTVLSFLPIFGLSAAEGKLFHPLAYTKTYAIILALGLGILVIPVLAHLIFAQERSPLGENVSRSGRILHGLQDVGIWRELAWILIGVALWFVAPFWVGAIAVAMGVTQLARPYLPARLGAHVHQLENVVAIGGVVWLLSQSWMPLGLGEPMGRTVLFVSGVVFGVLGLFWVFLKIYEPLLRWVLGHKLLFILAPLGIVVLGALSWRGAEDVLGWAPELVRESSVARAFPGLGEEFMPPFDEGQFLYMPTVMPHASMGQALEQLRLMDAAIAQIPEIEEVVGKLGRVDSALDPAPISMFETVITYKPEWTTGANNERVRQWREHIRSPDDIWTEIVRAAEQPGLTSAPKLMPINTRIVMLQSGMRANMGIKIQGPSLEVIAKVGESMEKIIATRAEQVRPESVFAERVVGKPYLELRLDREALARHGLSVSAVQQTLSIALGGMPLTTALQGRERFEVRVRYERAARQSVEALRALLVNTPAGERVPLEQLVELTYVKGPQAIKSEDTFLTSQVIFAQREGFSEVQTIESVRLLLEQAQRDGSLVVPAGVTYAFAGNYENQLRSQARLKLLVPLALILIFLVLYVQFRSATTSLMVFGGVVVAVSGGFLLLWGYQQPWFLDVQLMGHNMRDVFHIAPFNLSVAVWVGMIALAGVATDDGVVMATYLTQRFEGHTATSIEEVRELVVQAGSRRVRPCLMTTATTLLALLPVMTSAGRGADVMIPMAIPSLGGMAIELVTLFVVPVLYCAREEAKLVVTKASTRAQDLT